jgi:hypothetical protein
MDGTPGGRMTPPRDHDATEDYAPVIPLRRRQHERKLEQPTAETGLGGIWDPDAPLPSLTQPHSRCHPSTEAPPTGRPHPAADGLEHNLGLATSTSGTAQSTIRARRSWRRASTAAACCLLATAAVALAVQPGTPPPKRVASGPATHPSGQAVGHPAAAAPRKPTHHAGRRMNPARRGTRPKRLGARDNASAHQVTAPIHLASHRSVRHSRNPAVRPAPPLASAYALPRTTTATVAATVPPPAKTAPAQVTGTPTLHNRLPNDVLETANRPSASACVPGELGC